MATKYSDQFQGVGYPGTAFGDGVREVNTALRTDNITRLGVDPKNGNLVAGDRVLVSKLHKRDSIQEIFLKTTGTIQIGTLKDPSIIFSGTATGLLTLADAYWLAPLTEAMDIYITVAGANDIRGYIRYTRN